jgi:hypothetical protein
MLFSLRAIGSGQRVRYGAMAGNFLKTALNIPLRILTPSVSNFEGEF